MLENSCAMRRILSLQGYKIPTCGALLHDQLLWLCLTSSARDWILLPYLVQPTHPSLGVCCSSCLCMSQCCLSVRRHSRTSPTKAGEKLEPSAELGCTTAPEFCFLCVHYPPIRVPELVLGLPMAAETAVHLVPIKYRRWVR